MKTERLLLSSIPAVVWGEPSTRAYLYAHGRYGCKEEAETFARLAEARGFQVLSFDLAEHGERQGAADRCTVQQAVHDYGLVADDATRRWESLSFFGCSLGAYFGLMSFGDLRLERCLFHAPILDMARLIGNMMQALNVSEQDLFERQEIDTPFGETLSWAYFDYVKTHPIRVWTPPTHILYGACDAMTEPDVVRSFCDRFQCALTTVPDAGHFFEDPRHLRMRDAWIEACLREAGTNGPSPLS